MLRLTGGEFRGRTLLVSKNLSIRPTQARLRQALFNSLQGRIGDSKVLDLFAGSGALGFEALSRGAIHVCFVEDSPKILKLIEKNAQALKVTDRVKIYQKSADQIWPRLQRDAPFDLVLADPPYAGGWEEKLLNDLPWQELLKTGGLFCLEWGRLKSMVRELPEKVPFLVKVREKNYGESVLTTYMREP